MSNGRTQAVSSTLGSFVAAASLWQTRQTGRQSRHFSFEQFTIVKQGQNLHDKALRVVRHNAYFLSKGYNQIEWHTTQKQTRLHHGFVARTKQTEKRK
jgi:hypothetical protein